MKTWQLDMSNSEAYIEECVLIEKETEPTCEECKAIAKEHGYKYCSTTELWWLKYRKGSGNETK